MICQTHLQSPFLHVGLSLPTRTYTDSFWDFTHSTKIPYLFSPSMKWMVTIFTIYLNFWFLLKVGLSGSVQKLWQSLLSLYIVDWLQAGNNKWQVLKFSIYTQYKCKFKKKRGILRDIWKIKIWINTSEFWFIDLDKKN